MGNARAAVLLVTTLVLAAPAFADETPAASGTENVPVSAPPAPEEKRWSSFLPLMAEEARKRGYELPLPFGVSGIYNYLERDIEVSDLRIGVDGAPLQSVSDFVDLGSNSRVNVYLGRFDVWVLPFLNVYALIGDIDNKSTTRGSVTIPLPGPGPGTRTFDFTGDTSIEGVVGGGGLTVAAGYQQFFMMVDANYTQSDLGFDDEFRALVVSTRAGWNGDIRNVPTRIWAGLVYWDTKNTASATVEVPDVGTVSFEADQGPDSPWNPSIGGSVAFSKHWEGMAEYGFNFDDVKILVAAVTYRF